MYFYPNQFTRLKECFVGEGLVLIKQSMDVGSHDTRPADELKKFVETYNGRREKGDSGEIDEDC